MALGDLVKSLIVRFSSEGFPVVREEIFSIPDEKTVNVNFDANGAVLSALGAKLEAALANAGDQGGSSFWGNFFKSAAFSGFGSVGPIPSFFTSLPGLAAAAAAIGLIASYLDMLVSGFAAAGQGVAAFAALAYPTFSTISGAVSTINTDVAAYQSATTAAAKATDLAKIKADWAALDPVQKTAVKNVLALQSQFDQLAANFESALAPLLNTLLGKNGIISQIIQDLPPFANAAAKAFGPLLTQFNNFLKSPGAASFQSAMVAIEKLAIPAIGQGIGQVATALGKLLTIFSAKDDARAIRVTFDIIAGAINGIGAAIRGTKAAWDWISHTAIPALKPGFDWLTQQILPLMMRLFNNLGSTINSVIGAVIHAFGNFNHAIDNVRHFVATAVGDLVKIFLSQFDFVKRLFTVDIENWGNNAVSWFHALPGKILGALSGLAGQLFAAGAHIVQSLIAGLASQLGNLLSMAARLASAIAGFFPNSPAKMGPFSGVGAPEKRGEHISWALSQGMLSNIGLVSSAASQVAFAAAGYGSGRGIGGLHGPSGVGVTINFNGIVGDPHRTAMEIQQMLLSLKRRRFGVQGNTSSGLGLA